jgi:AAA+ ATPase superfamily predicted ATPase
MRNLSALGIIKKETPFAENSTRKTIYKIDDNLFRFWYRFIPDNIAAINRGLADTVYKRISPQISEYMGAVFEDICMQYLWKLREQGRTKIEFGGLGRWWGNDAKNKCEAKIDIMGTDGAKSALFCECKWTNEKIESGVLDTLIKRSRLFSYDNVQFYLFAKNGFTRACLEKAHRLGNVTPVTFREIMKI